VEGVLRADHNHTPAVVAIGTNSPGGTPLPFARGASLRYSPLSWENKKHPDFPGSVDQSVGHKPQEITHGEDTGRSGTPPGVGAEDIAEGATGHPGRG